MVVRSAAAAMPTAGREARSRSHEGAPAWGLEAEEKSDAQSRAALPAEELPAAFGLGGAFRRAKRPGGGRSVRKVLGSAQRRR